MTRKKAPDPVAQLRGKLGALQQRYNADHEFFLLQMALLDYEKSRSAEYHRAVQTVIGGLWVHLSYDHQHLADIFIEGLKARMQKFESEHQAKVAERRAEYEKRAAK